MPAPQPAEGSLPAQFMAVMGPTGWMKLVGAFQFLGGLLVIIGRTAPLGLAVLGPVNSLTPSESSPLRFQKIPKLKGR